ncbi:hypothetical protein ABZ446_04905 [Streptomyces sp. NPDC005813]|uniref:hypothetical protein n=1 Tax=Streptomyces sp. NPDC005813 TaxID=3155592 RepID=UPI0033D41493
MTDEVSVWNRLREAGDRFKWTLGVILLFVVLAALTLNAVASLLTPLLFLLGGIDH